LLPAVFVIIFIVALSGGYMDAKQELLASEDPVLLILPLGGLMLSILIASFLGVAILVYYLIHIINNPRLDSNQRLMWAFVVLLAGTIGRLVYWLFQIWREDDDRIEHSYNS
jgi:hypothetical protein